MDAHRRLAGLRSRGPSVPGVRASCNELRVVVLYGGFTALALAADGRPAHFRINSLPCYAPSVFLADGR